MSAGWLRFLAWYPLVYSVLVTLEWVLIAPLVLAPGEPPPRVSEPPGNFLVLVVTFVAIHIGLLLGHAAFVFAQCRRIGRTRGRVSAMEQMAILGALIPWVGLPINRWLNDPRRSLRT